jgi:hypothetical protein
VAVVARNETVENVQFSYFLRKTPFEYQELMSDDFQVLGFFDSLNKGLQQTAAAILIARGSLSRRAAVAAELVR